MTELLLEKLIKWVTEKEANGIKQHSKKWHAAKVNTIGGSSLADIQRQSKNGNGLELINKKIGLTNQPSVIAMQWGNLFEELIKKYIEWDKKCTVYGEDLYVEGPPGCSYSPDGFCVMNSDTKQSENDTPQIFLCEFKCPYSRIPSGKPPSCYIPQIQMGLSICDIATIGFFAEAVFRRCTWDQLGPNPSHDTTLVSSTCNSQPLAYGLIGFYFDEQKFARKLLKKKSDNLIKLRDLIWEFEKGTADNEYKSIDLGDVHPEDFTILMNAYNSKILRVWYSDLIFPSDENQITKQNKAYEDYTTFCSINDHTNFGVLPWKLLKMNYNIITKINDYLEPWLQKIQEMMEVVKNCNLSSSQEEKLTKYNNYLSSQNIGFSDSF